jgi:hypothetical protein
MHNWGRGLHPGWRLGWISRKFGYAADNLISVDIVTADGEAAWPATLKTLTWPAMPPAAGFAHSRAVGRPLADTIGLKPFVENQTMLDAGQPFGRRYYWKPDYFAEMMMISSMPWCSTPGASPRRMPLFSCISVAHAQYERGRVVHGICGRVVHGILCLEYPGGVGEPAGGSASPRLGARGPPRGLSRQVGATSIS